MKRKKSTQIMQQIFHELPFGEGGLWYNTLLWRGLVPHSPLEGSGSTLSILEGVQDIALLKGVQDISLLKGSSGHTHPQAAVTEKSNNIVDSNLALQIKLHSQ